MQYTRMIEYPNLFDMRATNSLSLSPPGIHHQILLEIPVEVEFSDSVHSSRISSKIGRVVCYQSIFSFDTDILAILFVFQHP